MDILKSKADMGLMTLLKERDNLLTEEYEAALRCDLFDTVFFDYEKWFYHGELVLSKIIKEKVVAVYRGWMMNPEEFERFMIKDYVKSVKGSGFPNFFDSSGITQN